MMYMGRKTRECFIIATEFYRMHIIPLTSDRVSKRMATALSNLLAKHSKHSAYQEFHPWIRDILECTYSPPGKLENLRWSYMVTRLNVTGMSVMDIGANTGYFSFGSLEQGAAQVEAFEGNREHAIFLREAAKLLGLSTKLRVKHQYFNFEPNKYQLVDLVVCMNVLHHLGSDFDDIGQNLVIAKKQMQNALRHLARITKYCWFQIGFNWKGDRFQPLFANGLKDDVITFMRETCTDVWNIAHIAIYNPLSHRYEALRGTLLKRHEDIGEFLNRPLFLLQSCLHDVSKSNNSETLP